MKNAAMVLGVIGGGVGMIVGFFAYGWIELGSWLSGVTEGATSELMGPGEDADRIRFISLFAPILGIAGGAMSHLRPVGGAVLMLASAAGMYWGFGFGVFTMFPIAMCLVGGVLGLMGLLTREP